MLYSQRELRTLSLLLVGLSALGIVQSLLAGEPSAEPEPPKVIDAGPLRFTETRLLFKYTYSYAVVASDLDGDGDLDLTSADAEPNSQLYLLLNDGRGNFKHSFIQKYKGEDDQPVRLERHAHGDINGDGLPDVVIVDNLKWDIRWFEHPGNDKITQEWKLHRVCDPKDVPGSYDVALSDLDGDGDLDVAASSWRFGNRFDWFENIGSPGKGSRFQRHEIDAEIGETRTIVAADFSRDGRPDLLGTSRTGNTVMWYENSGEPRTQKWKKRIIDDKTGGPAHGHPVDLDADGDLDVIMAFGIAFGNEPKSHQLAWYENVGRPGAATSWQKHKIVDPFPSGFEVVAGDFDGDKDLDLAATGWTSSGQVVWIENTGDPKTGWKMHTLKKPWTNAVTVVVGDFNQDGRPDIAAAAERTDNEIRWWRNDGPVNK